MPSFHNRIDTLILWADLFIVSICFFLTVLVFKLAGSPVYLALDILLWGFLLVGWFFTAKNYDLYVEASRRGLINDLFKIGKNIAFQGVFISLFLFLAKQPGYSRRFVAVYILLLCVLIPLQKIFYKKVLVFLIDKRIKKRRVLIIGAGNVGMNFRKALNENPQLGYHVVGFLDDTHKASLNGQYLGKIEDVEEVLNRYEDIDEIVVALPNSASKGLKTIINAAQQEAVRLRIIPDYFHYFSSKYGISMFEGLPMITLRREPLEEFHWRVVKRLFDTVFSILVLVFICSWLFPIIAILIKLESKGPVFFTQLRTGRNKIPFKCIKFRSMQVNDDANSKQAQKNDSRLTRVGKFLRKSNLDEFPQFINVLFGEMSIVGPRPHMIKHTEEYAQLVDRYLVRHLLKAGITGWAQVNGHRGETRHPREMLARVEHDVWYLENWSLIFDIKIIFLTVWNTIKGEQKAY
ncbi:undecaprenyl-phosphate glucose phosphotransferase [Daejeonella oryzae]|uniref:undecaprenyl-phosphate glucose phosphotransferase n=1 Tax=Daejeonella oryzae TaxID=1122943 RepID=UPI0004110707|nr:undecaprenyl-phosphate glucose phosphotransferase [Daejeonella oryzae]